MVATIKKSRPELLFEMQVDETRAIPEEMPEAAQVQNKNRYYVEDVGEPITASFLTKTHIDPTGW